VAHLFIVVVNDNFNRKNVNLSQIYYVLDFSFFMSQDDAYYHIHQNDPQLPHSVLVNLRLVKSSHVAMSCKTNGLHLLLFDEERINKPTDSYIGWTQTAMYLCTCPSVVNLNRIAPIDHHLG